MVYANIALESRRFCGCGQRRTEGNGFAEVGELCLGVQRTDRTSSRILEGRDCPGDGGGGPPAVEDTAVSGGGEAETLADR